jgi:hypothetical protein
MTKLGFVSVNNLSKSFEIKLDGKGKTGEVLLTFSGMDVNMTRFPKRNERRQTNGKSTLG